MIITTPELDYFRRLVAMYGDDTASFFFKRKTGKQAPPIIKEESFIDLNSL